MRKLSISVAVTVLVAATAHATEPKPVFIPDRDEREMILITDGPDPRRTKTLTFKQARALATQEDFDATHYLVDLDFNETAEIVSGSVTVTAQSLTDGLQQIVLDLRDNMSVSSVTQLGVPVSFNHSENLLTIDLADPVNVGGSFTLLIAYSGSPEASGLGTFGWNRYASGSGRMVWSLSEPEGARNWWPCKDRPDDKAIVEEWWTVRPNWIATGNGRLLGVDTLPNGRKRYRWRSAYPLTTYLVSIAAADFATFSDSYELPGGGELALDYYVYPEDLADAQASFTETAAMMAFFEETFGEYPFIDDGKYGMSAFPFSGAMEHTTNSSYGYILIDGTNRFDFVIAHELAHQWFGDSVSPATWPDLWLNEGFASYSEALWTEHVGGTQAYRDYMNALFREAFGGPIYDPIQLFGRTVYNKGAWAVHMLRGVMGDTAFFAAIRDWYAIFRDGAATTAQLQATLEARHGATLDWFFTQWIYGENRPNYEFGYTEADLGDGTYRYYVQVRQTQTNAGVFTMPIQLTLLTDSGNQVQTVWNDLADQYFVLETAEPVNTILFDEANWILKSEVVPIALADADGDSVPDASDNCPATANTNQVDTDLDLAGNACDPDDDGDTLLDADDCAPLDADQGEPELVAVLQVDGAAGQPTALSWSPAARADDYRVIRGQLSELGTSYGNCVATGLIGTSFDDGVLPASGQGFLYLVQAHDSGCGGAGSLGAASNGAPRVASCP